MRLSDLEQSAETLSPLVRVVAHPRARRLALRVNSGRHTIDLVVPRRTSLVAAHAFLHGNSPWIERQLARMPKGRPFTDGLRFTLMDEPTTLRIAPNPQSERTIIDCPETGILRVRTHLADPSDAIIRHLKKCVLYHAAPLAHQLATSINRRVVSVSVKKMTSRWGSCSPDGRLALSAHLAFVPLWALDYVVAHEVAHLVHFDHSAAFWEQCQALCPRTDEARAWFNEHGNSVWSYGAPAPRLSASDGTAASCGTSGT